MKFVLSIFIFSILLLATACNEKSAKTTMEEEANEILRELKTQESTKEVDPLPNGKNAIDSSFSQ